MHNVVVTGGSRGLGLGIAQKLAASGYRVIAIARQPTELLSAGIEAADRNTPGSLHFRAFDLSDTAGIPGLVAGLRQEFGQLHGLVNNAALGTSGILATMQDQQIERLTRLNVVSPMMLTKYVVRSMMVGGAGRIVNISSIVSFTGYSGLSVYAGTKAALVGFTRSLARELGPLGITVNGVAPGFLATEMTKDLEGGHLRQIMRRSALRRLPEVEDVANAVDYLMSENARNVTGTLLTVDAGNTV